MSYRSNFGAFVAMPTTAFSADRPVSTSRAYSLRNNLQHLIDSAGQYRVSWASDLDSEGLRHDSGLDPDAPAYASWTFPLLVTETAHPMNLDIRVAAKLESAGSALVAAILAPANSPRSRDGAALDTQWFRSTATATSTSAVWSIDEVWEWDATDRRYLTSIRSFPITENSTTQNVDVVMARLEVLIGGITGELESSVVAVQLREYP